MNAPQFRAHIEKRRLRRGHGWYCITREISAYEDARTYFGPFRLKRDAKVIKDSAKESYARNRLVLWPPKPRKRRKQSRKRKNRLVK